MTDRPTMDQRRKLAQRLIDAGADPVEARREAGVPEPPDPPSRSESKPRSRSRSRKRRRRSMVIKVPRSSSAGALVAQSLGLVALYWFVRNAGSAAGLIRGVRRAFDWWISPAPLPF